MTDKQIIIDGIDVSGCSLYEDNPKYRMWGTCDCMRSMVDQSGYDELAGAECKGYNCYYKQLKRKEGIINILEQECTEKMDIITALGNKLTAKEQEYEELQQYHNKCCKEFENKKQELLEKHNQVSIDFYSGKYCNKEKCSLLKVKEQECEEFRKANDEKNELLAKLGCPTIATARRKVFCLQEQLDQLKADNKELKDLNTRLDNQRETYWKEYQKLKATLTEIKEIAQYDVYTTRTDLCLKLNWIKKKISECEGNDGL